MRYIAVILGSVALFVLVLQTNASAEAGYNRLISRGNCNSMSERTILRIQRIIDKKSARIADLEQKKVNASENKKVKYSRNINRKKELVNQLYTLIESCLVPDTGSSSSNSESSTSSVASIPSDMCDTSNAKQRNDRLFGIDVLNASETSSFGESMQHAKNLGADFVTLHLPWTMIEPSPGNYVDPINALSLIGGIAKSNNMKVSLTIRPIDATGKTVPSDLENKRFSDPEMINRFNALSDFIFTKIDSDTLVNYQIGNEVDHMNTAKEHPSLWSDYGTFLFKTRAHLHAQQPGLKVGFTATLEGVLEKQEIFKALSHAVDHIGVNYYPLDSGFNVEDPSIIHSKLSAVSSEYSHVPIYLQEIGYQTSALNKSSEEKQAEFFCEFFKSWDNYPNIISANVVRLNDISHAKAVDMAGPYGTTIEVFTEYLRTLGLRTYDGKGAPKKAFTVIQRNLDARGW